MLSPSQLGASVFMLAIYFLSYVIGSLTVVPLLLGSEWIRDQIGSGLIAPVVAPLAGWKAAVVLLGGVVVLIAAIEIIVSLVQRRVPGVLFSTIALFVMPIVTLLCWDQPGLAAHRWRVIVAFIPTFSVLALPLGAVWATVHFGAQRLWKKLFPRAIEASSDLPSESASGTEDDPTSQFLLLAGHLIPLCLYLPLLWILLWG